MKRGGKRYPTGSLYNLNRFWASVAERDTGCLEWTGQANGDDYGMFRMTRGHRKRVVVYAHRFAYMLATGEDIGPDVFICHHCDNPRCVNPGHLYAGDNYANMRDAVERRRHRNLKKTHCPKCGLDYSPAPERLQKYGVKRVCWPCRNARTVQRRHERKRERCGSQTLEHISAPINRVLSELL